MDMLTHNKDAINKLTQRVKVYRGQDVHFEAGLGWA